MFDYDEETAKGYIDGNKAKKYKKAYTQRLNISNIDVKMVAHNEVKNIDELLEKTSGVKRILDIPCGTGKLANVLLKYGNVIAADISDAMIENARGDYESHPNFLGFVCTDAANLDFDSENFDCIVSLRLMHRVPSEMRNSMLKEFHRVSKKYLIISYGYTNTFHNMRLKTLTYLKGKNPTPCGSQLKDIEHELQASGWKIKNRKLVIPVLSSEIIFLCEKE